MLALKFDAESFYKSLCEELVNAADECMNHFLSDALNGLHARDSVELLPTIYEAGDYIQGRCVFYADAIMESYGTGTMMDTTSDYLQDYRNSDLWNPNRKLLSIAGRKKGKYTNIRGEEVESSGSLSHLQDITDIMKVYGIDINKPPKYQIQNAEKKLDRGLNGGYVDRIIEKHIESVLLNSGKYFYNVEV
jgi:hypothetical protein